MQYKLKISRKNHCSPLDYQHHASYVNLAKPYNNTNIENICTGQGGNFKYSPVFKSPIAEAYIDLTGFRKKDYLLAEQITHQAHMPGKSVWHHVWKQNEHGEYLMQLVNFKLHQSTVPHAGGCKLWLINKHASNGHYKSYRPSGVALLSANEYTDYEFDYQFYGNQNRNNKSFVIRAKSLTRFSAFMEYKMIGIDAFGNLIFQTEDKRLYVYDHEFNSIRKLSVGKIE